MVKYFLKKIETIYEKKVSIILFFYLIFVTILSLVFSTILEIKFPEITNNHSIILKELQFNYGQLTSNIFYNNNYVSEWNGIDNYLVRHPFLPHFVSALGKITLNLHLFLVLKNLIFFSILFFTCNIFIKTYNKNCKYFFIFLSIFFYNYYNLTTSLNFFFSDSFIAILLPSTFFILISNFRLKYIILSLLLFCLYFTKTTMFFITCGVAILFYILEKDAKNYQKILPLIFVSIAIIIWGSFGYIKTGKFPIGASISSNNQEALSIVLNKEFHKYYPRLSVDLIPKVKIKDKFKNEWGYYEYYKKLNSKYIEKNKERIFKDILIKIKFILFNYRKDSVTPDEDGNYENPIMFSHIINRMIFILSILFAIKNIYTSFSKKFFPVIECYFLLFLLLSIAPYIVGWATSKHLVPIFLVCHIYFFLRFLEYKKFKI